MSSTQREESPASRALTEILKANGKPAERLRTEIVPEGEQPIHRTKLWVYSTGRGKPNVETAAFIERITDGAVAANSWETDKLVEDDAKGSAA